MQKDSRIFVAGHRGLVGSALVRALKSEGCDRLLLRTRSELDLRSREAVRRFFEQERPQFVFLAAARVGGIVANASEPVEFLLENLYIQSHVLEAAHDFGVEKLLFLGSSCIYPKFAEQPIREESLLGGHLEPTNEPYAVAKIAGIRLCQAYHRQHGSRFISAMPTNLYGPNDNFDLQRSHVLPALIRKFHDAKVSGAPNVTIWGTGNVYREFLHVDDLASACLFLMQRYESSDIVNVGTGQDITIRTLAEMVREVVGFTGGLEFDTSKPDGTPRKQLDVSRLRQLGWQPSIELREGIRTTYEWFIANQVGLSVG